MRRAFTLVELLVAIVIIAVVASIAMPKVAKRTLTARESRLKQDLKSVRSAIERFHLDTGGWPANLATLIRTSAPANYYDNGRPPTLTAFPGGLTWQGPYLTNAHVCPIGNYEYSVESPAGAPNYAKVNSDSVAIGSDGTAYNTW